MRQNSRMRRYAPRRRQQKGAETPSRNPHQPLRRWPWSCRSSCLMYSSQPTSARQQTRRGRRRPGSISSCASLRGACRIWGWRVVSILSLPTLVSHHPFGFAHSPSPIHLRPSPPVVVFAHRLSPHMAVVICRCRPALKLTVSSPIYLLPLLHLIRFSTPASLRTGWSAWVARWQAKTYALRRLKEAGKRIRCPALSTAFGSWDEFADEARRAAQHKAMLKANDSLEGQLRYANYELAQLALIKTAHEDELGGLRERVASMTAEANANAAAVSAKWTALGVGSGSVLVLSAGAARMLLSAGVAGAAPCCLFLLLLLSRLLNPPLPNSLLSTSPPLLLSGGQGERSGGGAERRERAVP